MRLLTDAKINAILHNLIVNCCRCPIVIEPIIKPDEGSDTTGIRSISTTSHFMTEFHKPIHQESLLVVEEGDMPAPKSKLIRNAFQHSPYLA